MLRMLAVGSRTRRSLLRAAALATPFLLVRKSLAATWEPSRPVELIVGAGPGGGNDRVARMLQRIAQQRSLVPVPIVVVNRAGAGGSIAQSYLNTRAGDGHYLMVENPALVTNPLMGIGQGTIRSITPLARLLGDYVVTIGRRDIPLADGAALLAQMQREPGKLNIAVAPGPGTGPHLAIAMLAQAVGADPAALSIIPFGSAAAAVTSILGGQVDLLPSTSENVQGLIRDDRVRAFGVSAPQRLPGTLSSVPTWSEQGADVVFNNWRAVVGPRDMPAEAVAYWEGIFRGINADADYMTLAAGSFLVPDFLGSADFAARLDVEDQQMQALLRGLNLLTR
jgi:putative tricarboxylic transport membrane protein